ncbi:hypothetical protein SPF06_03215 [Sinomonas sp. JGH33]|uniref:Uncharacterized protein n=1 Tax=Sinomonas terricola TaxID=3110330 RepID=A0ABU5T238_9MICC|nr:hypothetical protein [Sinomonas sp. JGH33]MEA5453722.1 hypothetical protein [Sinomonas sp. JGH33]
MKIADYGSGIICVDYERVWATPRTTVMFDPAVISSHSAAGTVWTITSTLAQTALIVLGELDARPKGRKQPRRLPAALDGRRRGSGVAGDNPKFGDCCLPLAGPRAAPRI